MGNHRRMIVFSILIVICLILMAGCEEKRSQGQKVDLSKLTQQKIKDAKAVYINELKDIKNTDKIVIDDDSLQMTGWIPKNQETTLSKVTYWLHHAELYKDEIPKPKNIGKDDVLISNGGYTGPSVLNISTSNNYKITITPAYYVDKEDNNMYSNHYITNILEFNYDGQKTYIQSSLLYNWLKNDNWKTEFKHF